MVVFHFKNHYLLFKINVVIFVMLILYKIPDYCTAHEIHHLRYNSISDVLHFIFSVLLPYQSLTAWYSFYYHWVWSVSQSTLTEESSTLRSDFLHRSPGRRAEDPFTKREQGHALFGGWTSCRSNGWHRMSAPLTVWAYAWSSYCAIELLRAHMTSWAPLM